MTTFVHCRACGEKIHESAPTCPKCGAPQVIPTALGNASVEALTSASQPASAYGAVPWFRRRWFIILCLLSVSPIAGALSLTGPLYFLSKSTVTKLPKRVTLMLCTASAAWFLQLFSRSDASATALYGLAVIVMSLTLGLKNKWPEK